ncbi:MAG: M18 family aminopeptidase [Clostridia bacterium]|nr:M18 family aminopeptidase [Clostridia bacterium]
MDKKRQYADDLMKFLNNAPTPFQAVDELEKLLVKAGAEKLDEGGEWNIERGKIYYFTKRGTQIAAFRVGADPAETGFRIGVAHEDSPGFRIKSVPSKVDFGIERVTVEPYGGLIVHVWLDRPLAVAGRVIVKDENGEAKPVNINIKRPVLIIPSAAIHVDRGVNEGAKFNAQTQLCPFFAQNTDGKTHFTEFLAKEIGCAPEDILSFELAPYEANPGCYVGENEEFMSVARLDDAAMSHAVMKGLTEAKKAPSCDIAVAFDHEECGSNSDRGARSNTIEMIIDRVCEKFGGSAETKYRALAKSVVFSADMAHAAHPAYLDRAEPTLPVYVNKGPVLKIATGQSYASSADGSAFFKLLCEKNGIPYQVFNNRSDARGGGTIGPMISATYGVMTVDIGNPMLSMHSVRELGGVDDAYYMTKLFGAFYAGK